LRKRVLGAAYVDRQLKNARRAHDADADARNEIGLGHGVDASGLAAQDPQHAEHRDAGRAGQGRGAELHLGGAIRNGVTKKEIGEILLHSAIYCGYPARSAASARRANISPSKARRPPRGKKRK